MSKYDLLLDIMVINIKKTIIFVCLSIYFYLIFFLVYILSILLLTHDKGHRLREYIICIAFTLKFGIKSLLSESGDTGRGIHEPRITCSSCI